MRRFRFIGNPTDFIKPVVVGEIYPDNYFIDCHGGVLISSGNDFNREGMWQEVFDKEPEKLLHQTDLGYYSGEFLKSVFNNPECSKGSRETPMSAELIVKWAIDTSKELIKQLKEETK